MIRAASCTVTPRTSSPDELDLADMHAGPDSAIRRHVPVLPDRRCAVQCPRRPIERREHSVSGRLHLASAESLELDSRRLEVIREELAPARVAELCRNRRRVDEVSEEQGGEDSTVNACRKPREGSDPAPFDLDAPLVPDRKPVVFWEGCRRRRSGRTRAPCHRASWTPSRPERTTPMWRAWHHSPPTVGRTCVDQRQPGSETSWPTVRSPSSTMCARIPGNSTTSSGRSRLLQPYVRPPRLASADRVAHVRDRAQCLRERDGQRRDEDRDREAR